MSKMLIGLALVIVVLLLFLTVLFCTLIFYRVQEVKKKKAIAQYIETRQLDWYSYLLDECLAPEQLKPANMLEIEAIDELFFRIRYNFSSSDMTRRIKLFAMQYMEDYYCRQLKSRSRGIRKNALNKIYLFEWTFTLNTVLEMANRKQLYSKEEYVTIYKIIAKFSPTHFIPYFIDPKVSLGEFDYKKLLFELEPFQLQLLADEFDELPETLQLIIAEIIGAKNYLDFLPLLHHCLDSAVQELRIRALKSIAALEVADALPKYEEFAHSSVWEERLMTAKIFRAASQKEAEPVLKQLISDSSYQVRLQAAMSMKSLKNGQQALYSVITDSSDEFAVDVAEEMLGKE